VFDFGLGGCGECKQEEEEEKDLFHSPKLRRFVQEWIRRRRRLRQ
jgi:hypothetical protein